MVVAIESVHDLVGAENLNISSAEFFNWVTTETELPSVREMARLDDSVTVFSSADSPVETITELPQPEGVMVEPKKGLRAQMVNRKVVVAGLSVLAVQTACSWPEMAKVVDDVITFLPPSVGCIIFGGGLLSAWLAMIYKFAKYQDYSSQPQKKIPLKIERERKEPGSNFFHKR